MPYSSISPVIFDAEPADNHSVIISVIVDHVPQKEPAAICYKYQWPARWSTRTIFGSSWFLLPSRRLPGACHFSERDFLVHIIVTSCTSLSAVVSRCQFHRAENTCRNKAPKVVPSRLSGLAHAFDVSPVRWRPGVPPRLLSPPFTDFHTTISG